MKYRQIKMALRKQGFVELPGRGKHPKMLSPRGKKVSIPMDMNDWDRAFANFEKKIQRMGYWLTEPKVGSRRKVASQ